MTDLFLRTYRVRVDTFESTDVDCSFDIERTLAPEPNHISLSLYNLREEKRNQLAQLSVRQGRGRIRVEVEAGYRGNNTLLFQGDLRYAHNTREGPDWITEIEGEDGGRAHAWSRVSRSFPSGTQLSTVIESAARAMGVGVGNAVREAARASFENGGNAFTEGTVLSGNAGRELDRVLRSARLTYSIQNNALQVLPRGAALQSTEVVISQNTSLVGVPRVNANQTVDVTLLIQPDILPGRRVRLDSSVATGSYRVTNMHFRGDTFGDPWYIEAELQPLRTTS